MYWVVAWPAFLLGKKAPFLNGSPGLCSNPPTTLRKYVLLQTQYFWLIYILLVVFAIIITIIAFSWTVELPWHGRSTDAVNKSIGDRRSYSLSTVTSTRCSELTCRPSGSRAYQVPVDSTIIIVRRYIILLVSLLCLSVCQVLGSPLFAVKRWFSVVSYPWSAHAKTFKEIDSPCKYLQKGHTTSTIGSSNYGLSMAAVKGRCEYEPDTSKFYLVLEFYCQTHCKTWCAITLQGGWDLQDFSQIILQLGHLGKNNCTFTLMTQSLMERHNIGQGPVQSNFLFMNWVIGHWKKPKWHLTGPKLDGSSIVK